MIQHLLNYKNITNKGQILFERKNIMTLNEWLEYYNKILTDQEIIEAVDKIYEATKKLSGLEYFNKKIIELMRDK